MTDQSPTRSGGRAARRAARAAALPDHMRPIRPGMSCEVLKPLSQADVETIHRAALQALEEIGLADAPESGIAYLTEAGAIQGEDGRIRFPAALVEDGRIVAAAQEERSGQGRTGDHALRSRSGA